MESIIPDLTIQLRITLKSATYLSTIGARNAGPHHPDFKSQEFPWKWLIN